MAVAHKNFYPRAGSVEVANDPGWSWNGRQWMKGGRVGVPPKGAPLRGRTGTEMAGWYYDWSKYAWIEPTRQQMPPRPMPMPPRPAPSPPVVVVQPQPPAPAPKKETQMSDCNKPMIGGIWEGLIRHPILPAAGVALLIASRFLKRPEPPMIPPELPEPMAKWWQMNYAQNLAIWENNKEFYTNFGQALLTIGTANSAVAVEQLMGAATKKAA
jgi:hypothetical protein